MTDGYAVNLVGRAQDLGDGRYGVLVEFGDQTFYVEHAVTEGGLHAKIWNDADDVLLADRSMDWEEVITRMFTTWQQQGGGTGQ